MTKQFRVGDRVVYTRDKYTPSPGPRAKNIIASPNGESYQYQVDKFWVVADVQSNGCIVVETRRGKNHVIESDDTHLRKASLFERIFKANLFPQTKLMRSKFWQRSVGHG
jgi:hypothetical protein